MKRKRYDKKHQHYYSKNPKGKKKKYRFKARVGGFTLKFKTASGIFSPKKLDLGALTLIKYMKLRKKGDVLDLGCGYGSIGLFAAKICPTCNVRLVDINRRAVECAKKNIEINKIDNAKANQSYGFSTLKNERYDIILFNPPQTAGLDVCFELIDESYDHLKEKGDLQVVVRRRKGGKRFEKKLKEVFDNVEILGKKGGYWVYRSVKE